MAEERGVSKDGFTKRVLFIIMLCGVLSMLYWMADVLTVEPSAHQWSSDGAGPDAKSAAINELLATLVADQQRTRERLSVLEQKMGIPAEYQSESRPGATTKANNSDGVGAAPPSPSPATATATATATSTAPATATSKQTLKIHYCGRHFNKLIAGVLENEFQGAETSNGASSRKDPDWDLVYGGYQHCGTKGHEWDHKTGLVPATNFNALQRYQVWFPCMGAHGAYANKRELCKLIRHRDPTACYVLPDDRDELNPLMDGHRRWVVKQDLPSKNMHAGSGITYVTKAAEIPPGAGSAAGHYLVQPYRDPFLGPGQFARKSELRIYLSVTSTNPLRVYAYSSMYEPPPPPGPGASSSTASRFKCMHDTHAHSGCAGSMKAEDRQLNFDNYSRSVGWSEAQKAAFITESQQLLFEIIAAANPGIQRDPVNEGIHASGARCFSYLRADLGITDQMRPVLFEINEAPWTSEEAKQVTPICKDSHRELFRMMALDRPREVRASIDRETYEAQHLGNWVRLRRHGDGPAVRR